MAWVMPSSHWPHRGHSPVSALDDDRDLAPVDLDVEINPEPPAVADVGRPEESFWIRLHEHLLRALGRRAPGAEPVVVVVIGGGDERLARHRARLLARAQ